VLARYSNGKQTKRRSSGKATTAAAPAQSGRRRRTTTAKSAGGNRRSPSLGDQILALATCKPQWEIAAACKGARPNHIGIAIARHKRASRIEGSPVRIATGISAGAIGLAGVVPTVPLSAIAITIGGVTGGIVLIGSAVIFVEWLRRKEANVRNGSNPGIARLQL